MALNVSLFGGNLSYSSASISIRNFKSLASPIPKIWLGQNLKKTGHVTLTTPNKMQSFIPRLALYIFYRCTKFGDSRFSRSGDMIADVKMENRSFDPEHAPFRGGLLSLN